MQQRMYAKVWERVKRDVDRRLGSHVRLVGLFLGAIIVGGLAFAAIRPAVMSASEVNVLGNGDFESGFQSSAGCGDVGRNWDCFTNGGAANYGFYDDQWDLVVADGKHSQLIEINTNDITTPDADRYAGIAQTVRVHPKAAYTFKLRGMIRTTNLEGDPWRYRVQMGWLKGPKGDWRDVDNWVDVGWNTYYERTKPGSLSQFSTTLRPDAEVITVFVRVWKKWGVPYEEIDVNLDAIGLYGPAPAPARPGGAGGVGGPVQGGPGYGAQPGGSPGVGGPIAPPQGYVPAQPGAQHGPQSQACSQNLVYNGNFEDGFGPIGQGEVGRGWSTFTNGGAVHVGFRAEEWSQAIADGKYGQAIEISAQSIYPTDADRYAGIAQRIGGLHPGREYELSLRGLIRGTDGSHDDYRFDAQWGISEGKQTDWRHVEDWERLELGAIQPMEEPVSMQSYSVRFTAPASSIVLYVRGWKKWAVTNEQMILNLDSIQLRGCGGSGGPGDGPSGGPGVSGPGVSGPGVGGPVAPGYPGTAPDQGQPGPWEPGKPGEEYPGPTRPDTRPDTHPDKETGCTYTVRAGDTLAAIAQRLNVSTDSLVQANRIQNPNLIYVGQVLTVPTCTQGPPQPPLGSGPRPGGEPEPGKPEQGGGHAGGQAGGPPAGAPQTSPAAQTYTVRAGDTLSAIALRFDVSQQYLAQVNDIRNPNHIYVGQVLRIP